MFNLGKCGELMTINLNQDITKELAMLRGIDYARRQQQVIRYTHEDVKTTMEVYQSMEKCIVKVIFNDPATIVLWADGTKTVVKAENEPFDPEKGLAMAIAKHYLGNKGNYYNVFKKWLQEPEEVIEGPCNSFDNFKRSIEEIDGSV